MIRDAGRHADAFFRLIDGNPFGVYLVDADFRLARVSRGAEKVFSTVRPLLGRDFAEVLRILWTEPFAGDAIDRFRHTLATGEPYTSPSTVEQRNDIATVEAYDWRIERIVMPDGRYGVVCYFYDLSERQQYETALAASEAKLRLALNASNTGIWEWNIATGKVSWSPETYAIHGLEAADFDGTVEAFNALVHPADRARMQKSLESALCGREPYRAEFRVTRIRTGETRWVADSGQALFDQHGRPTLMLGTVTDITERKAAEERLRDSEAYFRATANAAPAILWITAPNGACTFLSTRWYEYTGQAWSDGLEFRWLEAVHPDDREISQRTFVRANERREPFSLDHRLRRADGAYRWVIDEGRPRFDALGNFMGFVGLVIDVHERRTAQEALRESDQRFRALADNISQLAWMADAEGEIFWYNRRWYEYTGTTLAQVRGWGWTCVHHPDHVDRVVEKISRAWRTGEDWEDTFPLRSAAGRYRWFLSRAAPIRDERGHIVCWFGTNTDITDQRNAEAMLRDADKRKDEFLAMLAHELRNPLAPLRNSLQILKRHPDAESAARVRAIMERQIETLVRLVDDLLDVSRITHGKLQLDLRTLDVRDAMHAALEASRPIIDGASQRLELEIPEHALPIQGDLVRLAQVFSNLLNNAVRYSPGEGVIRFSAARDGATVVVDVCDSGIGIAPELLDRVFDMFAQLPAGSGQSQHGLGIGLSLARRLVALHGGAVSAHSEGHGRGSRFSVRLPLRERAPQAGSEDR